MLVLEAGNVKKYFAEKLIVEVPGLKIYKSDRIGIVGLNGAGKTTLVNILSKRLEPDEGFVKLYGRQSYIRQLEEPELFGLNICNGKPEIRSMAGKFGIDNIQTMHMSGGERTRIKIVQGLNLDSDILFADEPTCNLDIKGIKLLEQYLDGFKGALMLISHDRSLLDSHCNRILEVENGCVKMYEGNYSKYKSQKDMELSREQSEYEQYVNEKTKLLEAINERKHRVGEMKKTPSRMGNSEARLHKRAVNGKKAKLDRAVKVMETRMEQMEVKERPVEIVKTRVDIQKSELPLSRIVISGRKLSKAFGPKVLFKDIEFDIYNWSKTALVGDNGTGKTTLVNMILSGEEGIRISNGVKIGYFSQKLDILEEDRTILENVMKESFYPEYFVRTILARLLFKRDDVYKKIGMLSGGERVKVSFAKIFVKDINVIILDEPTNYLDIYSQEALEKVLKEFDGTVLFVSHDRRFINKIADHLIILDDKKAASFAGNYDQYMEEKAVEKNRGKNELEKVRLLLETRLAEINSRLSMPSGKDNIEELDRQFREVLGELRKIKGLSGV